MLVQPPVATHFTAIGLAPVPRTTHIRMGLEPKAPMPFSPKSAIVSALLFSSLLSPFPLQSANAAYEGGASQTAIQKMEAANVESAALREKQNVEYQARRQALLDKQKEVEQARSSKAAAEAAERKEKAAAANAAMKEKSAAAAAEKATRAAANQKEVLARQAISTGGGV